MGTTRLSSIVDGMDKVNQRTPISVLAGGSLVMGTTRLSSIVDGMERGAMIKILKLVSVSHFREAAKKVIFLIAVPLRWGGR